MDMILYGSLYSALCILSFLAVRAALKRYFYQSRHAAWVLALAIACGSIPLLNLTTLAIAVGVLLFDENHNRKTLWARAWEKS